MSSFKVHLAAIMAFHLPVEGFSIFAHPIMTRFFKGLSNLFPHVWNPTLHWDFDLVLNALKNFAFKPMAPCSFLYSSLKISFLIAITVARRVEKLDCAWLTHLTLPSAVTRSHYIPILSSCQRSW